MGFSEGFSSTFGPSFARGYQSGSAAYYHRKQMEQARKAQDVAASPEAFAADLQRKYVEAKMRHDLKADPLEPGLEKLFYPERGSRPHTFSARETAQHTAMRSYKKTLERLQGAWGSNQQMVLRTDPDGRQITFDPSGVPLEQAAVTMLETPLPEWKTYSSRDEARAELGMWMSEEDLNRMIRPMPGGGFAVVGKHKRYIDLVRPGHNMTEAEVYVFTRRWAREQAPTGQIGEAPPGRVETSREQADRAVPPRPTPMTGPALGPMPPSAQPSHGPDLPFGDLGGTHRPPPSGTLPAAALSGVPKAGAPTGVASPGQVPGGPAPLKNALDALWFPSVGAMGSTWTEARKGELVVSMRTAKAKNWNDESVYNLVKKFPQLLGRYFTDTEDKAAYADWQEAEAAPDEAIVMQPFSRRFVNMLKTLGVLGTYPGAAQASKAAFTRRKQKTDQGGAERLINQMGMQKRNPWPGVK